MKKYIFGVDVGGTNTKYGIFDQKGNLIKKDETPTSQSGYKVAIEDITSKIISECESLDAAVTDILGVGIGVPGPVKNNIVSGCVNLGWGNFDIGAEFSKYLPNINVKSGNDANLAALGEVYHGAGKDEQNLLFVTLGTGIGGGIIVDGKLVEGFNGSAAEIGHLPLPYIPEYQKYLAQGTRYDLEKLASANGLVKCAESLLIYSNDESILRTDKKLSAKTVMDAAKNQDQLACEAVSMCAKYLAYGLAAVADAINPGSIIIGGGLSKAGDYFFDQVNQYYQEVVFHPNLNTKILASNLGNDAGIYGAYHLIV